MSLGDLEGKGWTMVQPPQPADADSVVARHNGEPIKGGILVEELQDSEEVTHLLFRSGQYDLEVKIDFDIGRGRVRVSEAEGYDNE